MGGFRASKGQEVEVMCRISTIFDEIQENDEGHKIINFDVEGDERIVLNELFKSKMVPSIKFI